MKLGYFEYMSLTYPLASTYAHIKGNNIHHHTALCFLSSFSPLDALSRGRILASPERVLALKDGPGAMLGGLPMLALTRLCRMVVGF